LSDEELLRNFDIINSHEANIRASPAPDNSNKIAIIRHDSNPEAHIKRGCLTM
jgi:hypothetical protein